MTEFSSTCLSCQLAFKDSSIQRQHFKTDFHRYNLKRKECELPPVSYEKFQKFKKSAEIQLGDKNHQQVSCSVCKKYFNTKSQYDNHVASKKHKDKVLKSSDEQLSNDGDGTSESKDIDITLEKASVEIKKINKIAEDDMEVDSDVETVDSDDWVDNPVESNNCIFCNHHSKNMTKNLKHMTEIHSFFIPYVEYCVDVKALLIYLGQKVSGGYMCLWCKGNYL